MGHTHHFYGANSFIFHIILYNYTSIAIDGSSKLTLKIGTRACDVNVYSILSNRVVHLQPFTIDINDEYIYSSKLMLIVNNSGRMYYHCISMNMTISNEIVGIQFPSLYHYMLTIPHYYLRRKKIQRALDSIEHISKSSDLDIINIKQYGYKTNRRPSNLILSFIAYCRYSREYHDIFTNIMNNSYTKEWTSFAILSKHSSSVQSLDIEIHSALVDYAIFTQNQSLCDIIDSYR
jgi:hypothetical protein